MSLVAWFKKLFAPTDDLIHCPTCGTTKLMQRYVGAFSTGYSCENGHDFHIAVEGP